MRKVSIALLTAGALALGACGGSEQANTANAVDDYNVAGTEELPSDNLALPADLNAADLGNVSTDTNTATTNTATTETTTNTTNGL